MRFENLEVSFKNEMVQIPVFRFGKFNAKKRLVVMGGVHGNEINGIGVLKNILSFLSSSGNESLIDGEIICLPVVNVLGFQKFQRRFKNKDLNRSYTDNPSNLPEKICYEIFKNFLADAEFGLDFHDSGSNYELLLHTRIAKDVPVLEEMTKQMNIKYTLVRKPDPRMLAAYALEKGTPVLTIESGGGGILHDEYLEDIMKGFTNFLRVNKYLKDGKSLLKMPSVLIKFFTRFKFKTNSSCIVKYNVNLSEKVKKGQLICKIYDPKNSRELEVYSKKDGYVFSTASTNFVGKRKVLCDIALDCCDYNINANPEVYEVVEV